MELQPNDHLPQNPMERRKKKTAFKSKALKFTKIVSLVGIRHATDDRNSTCRRCVWVVWLLFGFGFALFQIGDRIVHYRNFPSKTENKIVMSDELLFPQVTICNENLIMPNKATESGIAKYLAKIEEQLDILRRTKSDPNRTATVDSLYAIVDEFHSTTMDWKNLSKNLSQPVNETILRVSFGGAEYGNLFEEVITDLGHCFAFGTRNIPLTSTKVGAMNGLTVVLGANRAQFSLNSSVPGYKMLIHDPYEIPQLKEAGFSLRPGYITRVSISFRNISLQGEPYDKCNEAEKVSYKVINCQANMDYEVFKDRCKCSDIHMPDNGTICSYAQIINCTQIYENVNNLSDISTPNTQNSRTCAPQCHSRIYTPLVTESAFPLLMEEEPELPGDAVVLDRFRVHVFYPHMTYTESQSHPAYELDELICDISGALSLLLGATILTVYEGCEFFFLFMKDYLRLKFEK